MTSEIKISTSSRDQFIDITRKVDEVLRHSGVENGLCTIFVPHTTAAVTINENADPDVKSDIIKELDKIVPNCDGYSHCEGNSAAHIKSSLVGASETVIISGGRLLLGTWQGIYFCEFDGPRNRKLIVKIMEG